MYRNSEGYADPTAGAALGQIMKEYRQECKKTWKRENELRSRSKVYVVSRYAGDIDKNVLAAIKYCRFVIDKGKMPIAAHLLYPQILDDSIPSEREIGTMFGIALLEMCDEVWCFGKEISSGMDREIKEAKRLGKHIKYFSSEVV